MRKLLGSCAKSLTARVWGSRRVDIGRSVPGSAATGQERARAGVAARTASGRNSGQSGNSSSRARNNGRSIHIQARA